MPPCYAGARHVLRHTKWIRGHNIRSNDTVFELVHFLSSAFVSPATVTKGRCSQTLGRRICHSYQELHPVNCMLVNARVIVEGALPGQASTHLINIVVSAWIYGCPKSKGIDGTAHP
jgi:hypothetical protein